MSAAPTMREGRRRGFVLLAVLGAVLIVAALAFAMLFTASLDAMAVRARHTAVVARETLEAALTLAAAEVWQEHGGGATVPSGSLEHGPWPGLGVHATVVTTPLEAEGESLVVQLTALMQSEPARVPESLVLQVRPELKVLRRHQLAP